MKKQKEIRARIYRIVQFETDGDGKILMTREQIEQGLEHKSVKKYAYVKHDKDPNTRPHFDIVIDCPNTVPLSYVSKWFNVPQKQIEIPTGKNAFLNCIEYLTHERPEQQEKEKYHYPDDEISSNFDFRTEINTFRQKEKEEKERRELEQNKYGKILTERERLRMQVLEEGLSIRQLLVENPLAYQRDFSVLDKFRTKYLCENAKMPDVRINYYICGKGGIGKSLISRALARSLCPDLSNDDDIYFTIGTKGVTFEGYDGQPVVIWDDKRAADLLTALNGRDNVFTIFDPHPKKMKQQVKYSHTCLCNRFNIINGIQPYEEFLDGLAGEYIDHCGDLHKAEDKSQSYRRIPFIIPVHEEDFDLLMNKGIFEGTREYDQYIAYNNIRCNMRRIAAVCGNNEKLRNKIESQTVALIVDKSNQLANQLTHPQNMSDDEAAKLFEGYGKQRSLKPAEVEVLPECEQTSLLPPRSKHMSSDEIFCKI